MCKLDKKESIKNLASNLRDYYKQGKALEGCLEREDGDYAIKNLFKPIFQLNKLAEKIIQETKNSFEAIRDGNEVLNNFDSFSEPMKKVFLEYSIKSMAALEASQRFYEENKKAEYDKLHAIVLKEWKWIVGSKIYIFYN